MRILVNRSAAILLTLSALGAQLPILAQQAGAGGPTVQTKEGWLRGHIGDGVYEFLGIPYAQPPVGALRWRPPQAHLRWSGVRQATAYGNRCPQIFELGVFAGPPSYAEDCLFLNVVTPAVGSNSSLGRLPVILWIHGGGLFDGESNDYDGAALARHGVIVVTINYRLGLLGFVAHPALEREGVPFGNYGYLDQQLALQWVQRNIASFGGDPARVTVAGQSSGAASTVAHVISPTAKGLFSRAIFQSGWSLDPSLAFSSLKDAEQQGIGFAQAAGCANQGDRIAECLRALSVEQILSIQGTTVANGPYTNPGGGIVDGTTVIEPPEAAFASGRFNHMPIMNGWTRDESAFFVMTNEYYTGISLAASDYAPSVTRTYGAPAFPANVVERVLAQYPLTEYQSASQADIALSTDPALCGVPEANQMLATQVPVYAYEFDDRSAPSYFPSMSFHPGAYHTGDIQYLFRSNHGGSLGHVQTLSPQQLRLSEEMIDYWVNFARSGNPNGTRNSPWPRYTQTQPVYLSEDLGGAVTISEGEYLVRHECAFWKTISRSVQ